MGNAYRSVLALKPTGDAVPANVLAGKTFSNADGAGKTGTMANNGAVSITLTDQDPTYTIPEGYHNGSGVVGFTASGGDGADLIVTCSPAFAGATISCTDGTTTYQQICPSTAPFEVVFESIPVGTWTISGTAEGTLFSTQFTVVDFETVLNSIPEGSTVTPTDNIQTWLHCANIWNKNYTTVSQVLSDASTLQALIASTNAVDYMARSTTWASSVTSNSSAMSYIGLNNYCADRLLADSTWLNAIVNSTYFENVLNIKIPSMTSNTTPSGRASGSGVFSSTYDFYHAFDGSDSTNWISQKAVETAYLTYDFGQPINVSKIYMKCTYGTGSAAARTGVFKLLGSNDNFQNDSHEIDVGSNISFSVPHNTDFNESVDNTNGYRYFRLYTITHNYYMNNTDYFTDVTHLQLYGRASS